MKINWKVRIKNPVFWGEIVLAVLLPILAYSGMALQDLTTWGAVFDTLKGAVFNPYVLGLVVISVFNAVTDPTTKGLGDSERALRYIEPFDYETDESDENDEGAAE